MSAVTRPHPQPRLEPMTMADLDEVMRIEQAAYAFPWSRGNVVDSLAAGHLALLLRAEHGELLGYVIAMPGFEEVHLLNLTVAPPWQRRGLALHLLEALVQRSRDLRARQIWLEVRPSNERALALYRRYGFVVAGLRRGYYPAAGAAREDAQVMRLVLVQDGQAR